MPSQTGSIFHVQSGPQASWPGVLAHAVTMPPGSHCSLPFTLLSPQNEKLAADDEDGCCTTNAEDAAEKADIPLMPEESALERPDETD